MEFKDIAKERFSVRKYKDIPVEDEKIMKVLEVGALAPTANNRQPQKIYVVKSKDAIEKLRGVCPMAFDAPVVMVITCNKDDVWHSPIESGYDTCDIDGSIVTTLMMFEAWELGLGSCWVRYYDAAPIRKLLDLPDNEYIMSLLPMGYASEDAEPSQKHFTNKPLEDLYKII